jgi:hypothetical protein
MDKLIHAQRAEIEALRSHIDTLRRDRKTLLRLLHDHADPFDMPQEAVVMWDKIQKRDINNA